MESLKRSQQWAIFVTFGAVKWVYCVLEYKTSECSYSFSSSIKHFRITAYICLGFKIPRFEETSLFWNYKPDLGRELAFWLAQVGSVCFSWGAIFAGRTTVTCVEHIVIISSYCKWQDTFNMNLTWRMFETFSHITSLSYEGYFITRSQKYI